MNFIKKKIIFYTAFNLVFLTIDVAKAQKQHTALPTPEQVEWANAEIGVIIHLDINIYAPNTFSYKDKNTLPPLAIFNPSKLNTDQWIQAAKSAGAKYAILTAKHGTGFCLWPTKAHDYHVGNTPLRGGNADIVRDFIKSCKKYGIKPGLYFNTNFNTYYQAGYLPMSDEKRSSYNKAVYMQLKELWSEYGELFEIWFDGGVMSDTKGGIATEVTKLIQMYQPHAILFQGPSSCKNLIRWVGNEDGRAPLPHWSTTDFTTSSSGKEEIIGLTGKPDGKIWCPGEADFPNRKKTAWNGGWLWHSNQEEHLFSTEELLDRYYTSVGRNANMLIGMAIDTSGRFPDADALIFKQFGKKISHIFNKPLAETKGEGQVIELVITDTPCMINHIIIQEEIAFGEQIRAYRIESLNKGQWSVVCEGSTVGHKRIHKIANTETNKIRVIITKCTANPLIKNLSVYGSNLVQN